MARSSVALTYTDYEDLPNDGRRYEIHDGDLSVTPAPSPRHQLVLGNLYSVLRGHVRSRAGGELFMAPIDVILHDTTIVQPDLVYVASDHLDRVSARGIERAPTLVVEILSASTRTTDRHTKLQIYERFGVPHYWIVDPDARTVEAHVLGERGYSLETRAAGDDTFSATPFADLSIALGPIWA